MRAETLYSKRTIILPTVFSEKIRQGAMKVKLTAALNAAGLRVPADFLQKQVGRLAMRECSAADLLQKQLNGP